MLHTPHHRGVPVAGSAYLSGMLLLPAVVVAVALACRWLVPADGLARAGDAMRMGLGSSAAPVVAALMSAIVTWWVWGSLGAPPVIADEMVYLHQAATFASGRWSTPGAPIPEFFEQAYVLVTPRIAGKYPPGHALLLVPGVVIGLPGLMPVLLAGVAGGLTFALARRVAGAPVGLLAWVVMLSTSTFHPARASYFSETTTTALWLAGWWSLLEWREHGRGRWLVVLALCVGWGAITRPLTMLAFAIPAGLVVLTTVVRRHRWRQLIPAAVAGLAVVAIIPFWSAGTTGRWGTTPLDAYVRTYMPFDRVGFGLDSTPALRPLPHDQAIAAGELRRLHPGHVPSRLPSILAERARWLARFLWNDWRAPLAAFAALGLWAMPAAVLFATGTGALLLLLYLGWAHVPSWSIYYFETLPVVAVITALGLWRALLLISERDLSPRRAALHAGLPSLPAPRASIAAAVLTLLAIPIAARDLGVIRRGLAANSAYQRAFHDRVAQVPAARAIIFVRYAPNHPVHLPLVRNEPDLAAARTWIVYDRGDDNTRLARLAPERALFLYDESIDRFFRLPQPPSPPSRAP